MGVNFYSSPELVALSSDSDISDIGTPPSESRTNDFMMADGFDILCSFPSVPINPIKSAQMMQLFPSPPSESDIISFFPTPPSEEEDSSEYMDLESYQDDFLEIIDFPYPSNDRANSLSYDFEEMQFHKAVKDFNEQQIIQHVRDGHLPPPGQAYKIRRKESGLERSLVIFSNGTIFSTGKNQSILEGKHSIPGGLESELLGQGSFKRAFSVIDLNSGNRVVILVPKESTPQRLLEMQNEAKITSQIALSCIVPVYYFARQDKPEKAYLESELCTGGTMEQHQHLLENPIVGAQAKEAVNAIRRAGFIHGDYNEGNFIFVEPPNEQKPETLRLKMIDFGFARKATPEDPLDVWSIGLP